MKKVKIAVLGCGSIARIAHFPAISKRDDAELVAVCDTNEQTAKDIMGKWNAKACYTDYKKMFAECKMDAVIIATPNNVHRNQVFAAAKAGVDILVEKPIAVTNKEAWDMVEVCKKT